MKRHLEAELSATRISASIYLMRINLSQPSENLGTETRDRE